LSPFNSSDYNFVFFIPYFPNLLYPIYHIIYLSCIFIIKMIRLAFTIFDGIFIFGSRSIRFISHRAIFGEVRTTSRF
jgi:hypothetical protein